MITHCPRCGSPVSVADEPYCANADCRWNNEDSAALTAALQAQQQGQEPVAYVDDASLRWLADPVRSSRANIETSLHKANPEGTLIPLYAAPASRPAAEMPRDPITVAVLARAADRKALPIMRALNVFGADVTANQPLDLALIGAALSHAGCALAASPAAPQPAGDLHAAILNIPTRGPSGTIHTDAYLAGHRDARHAAAALVAAPQPVARMPLTREQLQQARDYLDGDNCLGYPEVLALVEWAESALADASAQPTAEGEQT
jgi:hypothetical protein